MALGWPWVEGEAVVLSPGQLAESRSQSQLLGPPWSPRFISNAVESQNFEPGGTFGGPASYRTG